MNKKSGRPSIGNLNVRIYDKITKIKTQIDDTNSKVEEYTGNNQYHIALLKANATLHEINVMLNEVLNLLANTKGVKTHVVQ